MKEFQYIIQDKLGIHARPAGLLVKLAKGYTSKITISKGDQLADVTKLIALMGLGIKMNDKITVSAEGEDEAQAITALQDFFVTYL